MPSTPHHHDGMIVGIDAIDHGPRGGTNILVRHIDAPAAEHPVHVHAGATGNTPPPAASSRPPGNSTRVLPSRLRLPMTTEITSPDAATGTTGRERAPHISPTDQFEDPIAVLRASNEKYLERYEATRTTELANIPADRESEHVMGGLIQQFDRGRDGKMQLDAQRSPNLEKFPDISTGNEDGTSQPATELDNTFELVDETGMLEAYKQEGSADSSDLLRENPTHTPSPSSSLATPPSRGERIPQSEMPRPPPPPPPPPPKKNAPQLLSTQFCQQQGTTPTNTKFAEAWEIALDSALNSLNTLQDKEAKHSESLQALQHGQESLENGQQSLLGRVNDLLQKLDGRTTTDSPHFEQYKIGLDDVRTTTECTKAQFTANLDAVIKSMVDYQKVTNTVLEASWTTHEATTAVHHPSSLENNTMVGEAIGRNDSGRDIDFGVPQRGEDIYDTLQLGSPAGLNPPPAKSTPNQPNVVDLVDEAGMITTYERGGSADNCQLLKTNSYHPVLPSLSTVTSPLDSEEMSPPAPPITHKFNNIDDGRELVNSATPSERGQSRAALSAPTLLVEMPSISTATQTAATANALPTDPATPPRMSSARTTTNDIRFAVMRSNKLARESTSSPSHHLDQYPSTPSVTTGAIYDINTDDILRKGMASVGTLQAPNNNNVDRHSDAAIQIQRWFRTIRIQLTPAPLTLDRSKLLPAPSLPLIAAYADATTKIFGLGVMQQITTFSTIEAISYGESITPAATLTWLTLASFVDFAPAMKTFSFAEALSWIKTAGIPTADPAINTFSIVEALSWLMKATFANFDFATTTFSIVEALSWLMKASYNSSHHAKYQTTEWPHHLLHHAANNQIQTAF